MKIKNIWNHHLVNYENLQSLLLQWFKKHHLSFSRVVPKHRPKDLTRVWLFFGQTKILKEASSPKKQVPLIRCFQKIGVPQNGWWKSWKTLLNPLKWMDFGGKLPIFGVSPYSTHNLTSFPTNLLPTPTNPPGDFPPRFPPGRCCRSMRRTRWKARSEASTAPASWIFDATKNAGKL